MPLNTSGQLSLGGATTGESVNLELGKSATATISMNDGDVRSLVSIASGAIRLPTDFYGKSTGPSYTRWYISLATPASHMRNVTFEGVSYSNSSSDPGLYVAMTSTFLNPGQTPYRRRPWFWKFNTDTQTLAWVQRAPVFDLTFSSTGGVENSQLAAVGSSDIQFRGGGGLTAAAGATNFCTPINTSTGAYTGTIQTSSAYIPRRSDSMFPTHNKQDCYFVFIGSNTFSNEAYVARLIPNTFTTYPFHIRGTGFSTRLYPISIDATNRIALFSMNAATSSSSSAATYQLHELDADFNIISGFNFTGELAGINRANATSAVRLIVSHNKTIVGNQNIFMMWHQHTPAVGITGVRVACMNFATKTITWQRNLTSSFSTGLYSTNVDQQSGPAHGILATDDGGCVVTWAASGSGSSQGYMTKLSASGVHQFTNRIIVEGITGMFSGLTSTESQSLVATRGSGVVINWVGGAAANTTSGQSLGYLVNLSVDPAISNVMPATSIGHGMTIRVENATQVTISSASPTIGLTTESPTYIIRQATSGSNVPILSNWTGTLGAGQVSTFTTPTVVGGTI